MYEEYEYSSEVNDIKPFIEYCEKNGYKKECEYDQTRTLYKNNDKLLARVTTYKIEGEKKVFFDLKDQNESSDILKVSKESGKIDVTNNLEFVSSMIEMLKFDFHKELTRKRYIYTKNDVKFEIDNYTNPSMNVVGIEGNKESVDKVYKIVQEYFKK